MQIETLEDVIEWCRQLHKSLSECLHHSSQKTESERARLLLDYLAEHEIRLAGLMRRFEQTADRQVLNTWCYEYFDKQPPGLEADVEVALSQMNTREITAAVMNYHEQVIELYRYLLSLEDSGSVVEVLEELLELEEHEAMRMVQSANRLEDL